MKEWKWKGLRSIIHKKLFKFSTDDRKQVHNNPNHHDDCMEEIKDYDKNQSFSSSSFHKVGFLPHSFVGVPSRGLNGLRKLGRSMSLRKNEQQEVKLCKKRIIMGKRCRPLNVSGVLHYDKDGVLVPEYFLSPSSQT